MSATAREFLEWLRWKHLQAREPQRFKRVSPYEIHWQVRCLAHELISGNYIE